MAPLVVRGPDLDVTKARRRRCPKPSWYTIHLVKAQHLARSRPANSLNERGVASCEINGLTPRVKSVARIAVRVEMESIEAECVNGTPVVLNPVRLPLDISWVHDLQQVAQGLGHAIISIEAPVWVF